MNHLYDAHFDEMTLAQEQHNAAIEKAQTRFAEATDQYNKDMEAAQRGYSDAVQASRQKLAAGLTAAKDEMNRVWAGEPRDETRSGGEPRDEIDSGVEAIVRARLPRATDSNGETIPDLGAI